MIKLFFRCQNLIYLDIEVDSSNIIQILQFLMMIVLIIVAASLMYTLENEAQPEAFSNILESIWWSVVTMTTVGYGDVTPVTTLGKVVAAFIMLIGVGLVALPAGMLAARFGDELRERKRSLDAHIKYALADGVIDEDEYSRSYEEYFSEDIDETELAGTINRISSKICKSD